MPIDFSQEIETVDTIEYAEFQERFMIPQKPVKIKNLLSGSEANKKWSPDFFKEKLGHVEVGVFNNDPCYLDRSYKDAPQKMKFADYLDLICSKPTDARLHLFNVFKHMPELKNDFEYPNITDRIVKNLPFAFFGGEGSVARIHRDMDNANVFLTEFWGKKKIVLFKPEFDDLLYRYPFTTHTAVDVENPDYDKYPGLHHVVGSHTVLEKGETLFMPSKYWHFIRYETVGIGFAFRSWGTMPTTIAGFWQAGIISQIDDGLRKMTGDWWFDKKRDWANERAQKAIKQAS